MDKHEFMRACQEGGDAIEEALRLLDRSLFATLYGECRRSVRDPEVARDVVQETFIKVWQRCATFRGDAELVSWIRSILRRAILDRLRRRDREVPMETEDDRELAAPAEAVDAARRAELDACFARCWRTFEEASPSHAAVLTWIVEEGLSREEISALLGRTPGATREFISQCRKRARIHLAEWYALLASGGPA